LFAASNAAICSANWSKWVRNILFVCFILFTCSVSCKIDVTWDAMVEESSPLLVVLLSLVVGFFIADFRVFFVLSPDLIVETVSSSDSSSNWTRFLFGEAGSWAGFLWTNIGHLCQPLPLSTSCCWCFLRIPPLGPSMHLPLELLRLV